MPQDKVINTDPSYQYKCTNVPLSIESTSKSSTEIIEESTIDSATEVNFVIEPKVSTKIESTIDSNSALKSDTDLKSPLTLNCQI